MFPRLRKIIFVSGCFWHRHTCGRCRIPATRRDYWVAKIDWNAARDKRVQRALRRLGAGQLADGVVALPADSRTREQLEWLADGVLEAGGEASVWLARPGSMAQERALACRMSAAVAAEYQAVITDARTALVWPVGQRPGASSLR